ncbi:acetyltransferase, GNAT family [Pochonia chlamydosporia 170]|uniref:Glucosamine 6-phosphate N-acetyltransferase n=1 Tax=Pochonia chlamydosporia 170 TaxID=1380566 RepID=A0A179G7N2_METCM|nr:acetyltransferase, GNAT family [Pochonia chlamydosporia 170]OAQ73189.1 acetyltransferase, GNAT family [Pochonia chlamydosporia 170]
MGTPFISFLGPSKLEGFEPGKPHNEQPSTIPKVFIDAMEVREEVFVREQNVPLENEQDSDDPRSCHWVVYASVNKTEETEVRDEDGNVIQPRKSSTRTTPIGTIRLVPFPHANHPKVGGEYWNNELKNGSNGGTPDISSPSATTGSDRPTTFHDGKEPYVKLGRLAVVKEYRGNGLSGLLIQTALSWLKSNPSFFDPSITELGLEQMGASTETEIPKWGGLVCVHAQEQVVGTWEKLGFRVDKAMGRWWEEGIPHVGMFKRLEISPKEVRI